MSIAMLLLAPLYMLTPQLYSGYMAPEYLNRGEVSMHLDIYNLGLIIMETTTGEKNMRIHENLCGMNFIDNVRQHQMI